MVIQLNQEDLNAERCFYCKKRIATKLCDAPIGRSRYIGHPPRSLMQKAKSSETA